MPLSLRKQYILESVSYYYSSLSERFVNNPTKTRCKEIELPEVLQEVEKRNHSYTSVFYFNMLDNKDTNITC